MRQQVFWIKITPLQYYTLDLLHCYNLRYAIPASNHCLFQLRELRQARHVPSFCLTLCRDPPLHLLRIVAVAEDRICEPAEFELDGAICCIDVRLGVGQRFLPAAN